MHNEWLKGIKEKAEGNATSLILKKTNFNNNLLSMEERNFLTEQLQKSLASFNNTIANLSTEQFNFRFAEDKWTIAECIEHITLAELRFPAIVKEELLKPSNPEYRKKIQVNEKDIINRLTNKNGKANSPEILKLTGKYPDVQDAISTFRNQRLATIEYVNTITDDLHNHFWKHPATGIVDLYQTIVLMSAHLERHIKQIEEVKLAKDFPKV